MRPVDRLIPRLDHARETGPDRWLARCPAHDDVNPSLAIRETDDGRVLVHCFAGCGAVDVVGAVGLKLCDLFPDDRRDRGPIPARDRHVPRDVLRAVAVEVFLVQICAEQVARGEALADADRDRLAVASARIRAAAREGGIHA